MSDKTLEQNVKEAESELSIAAGVLDDLRSQRAQLQSDLRAADQATTERPSTLAAAKALVRKLRESSLDQEAIRLTLAGLEPHITEAERRLATCQDSVRMAQAAVVSAEEEAIIDTVRTSCAKLASDVSALRDCQRRLGDLGGRCVDTITSELDASLSAVAAAAERSRLPAEAAAPVGIHREIAFLTNQLSVLRSQVHERKKAGGPLAAIEAGEHSVRRYEAELKRLNDLASQPGQGRIKWGLGADGLPKDKRLRPAPTVITPEPATDDTMNWS